MTYSFDIINYKPILIPQYGDIIIFDKPSDVVLQMLVNSLLVLDKKTGKRVYISLENDTINVKGVAFTGVTPKQLKTELTSNIFIDTADLSNPQVADTINQKGFEVVDVLSDIDATRIDYRDVFVISENSMYFYKAELKVFKYAKELPVDEPQT